MVDLQVAEGSADALPPGSALPRIHRAGQISGSCVVLQGDEMLPALCPACLAPGVRAIELPWLDAKAGPEPDDPELLASYCELCADAIESARTRWLSWTLALSLVCAASATAGALAFGSRQLLLQAVLSLAPCAAAGLALRPLLKRQTPTHWLYRLSKGRLLCLNSAFARRLRGQPQPFTTTAPTTSALVKALGLCAAGALLWLLGLHQLGGTKLVVLQGSQGSATLLVDGIKGSQIPASWREFPGAGIRLRELGGRRRLSLIAASGKLLAEEQVSLWPTHQYLLAVPPPGQCLFIEERQYGAEGSAHRFQPLPPGKHLHEVDGIDWWFRPLPDAEDLPTSGGSLRALRMRPCKEGT